MPRFRRYRVFLVSAIIIIILLFQVSRNSDWEPASTLYRPAPNPDKKVEPFRPPKDQAPVKATPEESIREKSTPGKSSQFQDEQSEPEPAPKKEQPPVKIPTLKPDDHGKGYALLTPTLKKTSTSSEKSTSTPTPAPAPAPARTPVAVNIPDRLDVVDKISSTSTSSQPIPTTIHWKKQQEFFPVPTESIIRLPTGTPKTIPTIQHVFEAESETNKEKREKRLAKVKAEAERAWAGYKKYAWTHDEVQPVSKQPRDPFCGWAATLVDSLDTLWIMGLKDEFEDAVKAVGEIDFTTTPYRQDIPVFETIIRYLGGLVAAYDVSGAKYPVLLDKALELAEILMGVFDTPNRMPILYYGWKPAFASQPHRASASSGVAELGTMSMEFTRLAQLTGQDRFYDAIARITDAFDELQNREQGTALPGIFPQNLDASGCNRTALNLKLAEERSAAAKLQEEEEARKAEQSSPVGYEPGKKTVGAAEGGAEGGAEGETPVADTHQAHSQAGGLATEDAYRKAVGETTTNADSRAVKRDVDVVVVPDATTANTIPVVGRAKEHGSTRAPPLAASGLTSDFDCPAQGLVATPYGGGSYSMGGSQDSAYEYFPKQYLLLGGLEPKYRSMHEKTVAAVKKYLLFRPMIEDESRDLLFSAKATSPDGTDENLSFEYEVTHLTCFLGGMFGLGGKIFGSEEDVEIGKRLADGCAWAYEVMPTGVMAEYSAVMPCRSAKECRWNETAWWERLDPNADWRGEQTADWEKRHAAWEKEVADIKAARKQAEEKAEKEKEKVLETQEQDEKRVEAGEKDAAGEDGDNSRPVNDTLPGEKPKEKEAEKAKERPTEYELRSSSSEALQIKKRAAVTDDEDMERTEQLAKHQVDKLASQINFNDPSAQTTTERFGAEIEDQMTLAEYDLPTEPTKPQTHEEFVSERLERDRFPKGFVQMGDRRYILRPEAIESVWYMYRITGDPSWQEKGWRMFESVIAATSTPVGHSAIDDVTKDQPTFTDNMESFWLAETLKYFYLLFTTPDVISLDEWVLNTEAHPFKRPS